MNHYPRNVGDFIKATLGMSLAQRGAYDALLDIYYAHERPLPLDLREVQNMAVTRNKAEREAVTYVLAKFFERRDDGWHQKRADEEIAAYRERAQKARANGASGGRPRKPEDNQVGSGANNRTVTDPVSGSKANQNQNQNHKAPVGFRQPELDQGAIAPLSGVPDVRDPKAEKLRNFRAQAVGVIAFLNEKTGRNYQPVDVNVDLVVSLLKGGATPVDIRQVIAARARKWKGDPKMDEYLRPKTLFNRTNFAQYVGELVDLPGDVEQEPSTQEHAT